MIGEGFYTLADVSRYTRVPPATIRSWFLPRSDGKGKGPVFVSDFDAVDGQLSVSFLNLIEAFVARFFRNEGVKPPTIRKAHSILRTDLGVRHPFAHATLLTDGGMVIRRTADALGNTSLTDVVSRNHIFKELEKGLAQIDYGTNALARQWHIDKGVLVNPGISYGRACVEGTGVSTYLLAAQYAANARDADLVAHLYRVTPEQVRNAVAFELGRKAA